MMDKNNKENMCSCPNCYGAGYGYHRHLAARLILGIIILLIVFWLGVKIGEFKGYFESDGFSYGRMMYGPMMWSGYTNTSVPVPATKTPTTTKK